jgi:hypothetical protein
MSGRRLIATTLAMLVVSAPGVTDTAQASSAYRFWNYFHGNHGQWQFAQTGAAVFIPADGSVEGWRYGISDGVRGRQPRVKPDFDAICAATSPESGDKRVAVVIDFGIPQEAPAGEKPPQPLGACAVVPTGFSGQQVLESVAQVRTDAMVCGINGYPATGCAVATRDFTIQQEPTVQLKIVAPNAGNSSASTTGFSGRFVVLALLIVAIGLAAIVLMRRRT